MSLSYRTNKFNNIAEKGNKMFISNDSNIEIGDKVTITENVEMFKGTFTKGHIFTVTGCTQRGFDLIDEDGNKLEETLFISDKIKKIIIP